MSGIYELMDRIAEKQINKDNIPVEIESLQFGTIAEYIWLDTDSEPELGATDRAFGVMMATATGEPILKYWNGASWEVVT